MKIEYSEAKLDAIVQEVVTKYQDKIDAIRTVLQNLTEAIQDEVFEKMGWGDVDDYRQIFELVVRFNTDSPDGTAEE